MLKIMKDKFGNLSLEEFEQEIVLTPAEFVDTALALLREAGAEIITCWAFGSSVVITDTAGGRLIELKPTDTVIIVRGK